MNSKIGIGGQHLLLDLKACDAALLDDCKMVQSLLEKVAQQVGATIVKSVIHQFDPQGVSGVVVIQESHLSIHTWPECGFASFDFYSCADDIDLNQSISLLCSAFSGKVHRAEIIDRRLAVGQTLETL